jgi:parallel beta-helix repeat protein
MSLLILLLLTSCQARTIVVDPSGSADARTPSGAISLASPGDTIYIRPGSYGGANVDRTVTLSGSSESRLGEPLVITAPGCKVYNLTVESGGPEPAVRLQSEDCLLVGCKVSGSAIGIQAAGRNNTVRDCSIESVSGTGMQISGNEIRVQSSTIDGNAGIRMDHTAGSRIDGCKMQGQQGILMDSSTGNQIGNCSFAESVFGIVLTKSSANMVANTSLSGEFVSGIDILNSEKNDIIGNSISGGKLGISLRNSKGNNLTGNICRKIERAGIYGDGATENNLRSNQLIGNGNGILLSGSSRNSLEANSLTQNTYGISLRGSIDNVLRYNRLKANSYNLRIDSGESSSASLAPSSHDFYNQDIDGSNLAEDKPVRYLVSEADKVVPADCGFLGIISCRNISASGLNITNNSCGILIVNSSDCRIMNSTISRSERGVYLLDCTSWLVEKSKALACQIGYAAAGCEGGSFENSSAESCVAEGFRVDNSMNLNWMKCVADSSASGISLMNSRLCILQDCTARQNQDAGIQLISSHKCILLGNDASSNGRGVSLSGSNSCVLENNTASGNQKDGISLEQLSVADVLSNIAKGNGQGLFVQSSKKLVISKNNLSENRRFGLRMSSSSDCNVTDNSFLNNEIAGVNLVDCSKNFLYHNVLVGNYIQNAADNGENLWDAGPKLGGNYWGDHKVQGNPGNVPRTVPAKGVDHYPFQDPWGWR